MKIILLALLSFCSLGLAAARAQTHTPAGAVTGMVSDAGSKLALAGVRVSVAGTPIVGYTDQSGVYHLANVPAGSAVLRFSYVGYPTQTLAVSISAGQAAHANLVFTPEIVRLSAYVITGNVVGTARAINEQRSAAALTDVVASDAIGQLPDKNVAEALERVPGVDISRDKGEGRFVEIRGLDPIYIGVSINDVRASTSEKGTREVPLDTIASDMIASLVVNKVNTPDMDADAMGGSVNVVTRSGFDQEGPQGMISAGGNYANQEQRKGGYNLQAYYGDTSANGKLGVFVGVASEYRPFTTYSEPEVTAWSQVKSPTDGQFDWILGGQDFRHYDITRRRDGLNVALDYKFGDTSKLWIRYLTSYYVERDHEWLTEFQYGSGTPLALSDTSATVSLPKGDIIKGDSENINGKNETSLVGGYEKKSGPWTDDLTTGYTVGKYTRPTVSIEFANTTATEVSYAFTDPYHDTVTQLTGPSIDSPSSYALSTKSSFTQTTANMHEETVRDNLRNDFDLGDLPADIQVGLEYRNKNNNENTFKEGITSIPWTLSSSTIYPGNDTQDTAGGFPDFRILPQQVLNFYSNQANYGQSLNASTTYTGSFQAREDISSAYALGDLTLGQLKISAGARLEATDFWIDGWQIDSTTGAITPAVYDKNYADLLPGVILTYTLDPRTIARASWTNTLARPDYSDTVPGRTVNDTTHTVSQGNPELDPLQAMNWDASLEHYYSSLGLLSGGFFYKSITNFSYQAQAGTDPSTGYLLTSYFNGPSAWIYGFELTWDQRFRFLPAPFDGLGIEANTTLGDSQATYPTRPGEELPFVGYAKKYGNVALTYDKSHLHLQVAMNYHGPRMEIDSAIGATATQDEYEAAYYSLDFGSSYSFSEHWQVYFNAANLNNAPLKEYYGGTPQFDRIQTLETYGWSAETGVRWNL